MYSYTPDRPLESDDELRKRLLYVAAPDYEHVLDKLHGDDLDAFAWCLNLERRRR